MLRIIVIALFVANLLLLGFQSSKPVARPETTVVQTAVEDSSIPTIYLFSEIMENRDLMSGNRQCFSLGPFHSAGDRIDVRTRLLEVSVSISERQTQALVEKGYWVFMPPYISLLEANKELLSLQAIGLNDIGIIYDGDWKNAISLGYFMRQENAQRRKESLEERGYAPLIRVQRMTESRYWLDYEQNPGSDLIALDMQNRPNDFMQRAVPCPEQALFDITTGNPGTPVGGTAQAQPAKEEAGFQSIQEIGTGYEENVDVLPADSKVAEPGDGNEATPTDTDDTVPGDNEQAVSGQSTEIEADSGNGTETIEG